MSRRVVVLLTAALAVTGGASFAADPDPEPEETGRPASQQAVTAVEPEQASRYAVLRRRTTALDRLSAQEVDFVDKMMTRDYGVAPALARRAQVTATGGTIHVIPGRGYVCLFATRNAGGEGTATCNRTGEAVRGYVVLVDWPTPATTRIVGLATDGVREVRLRARDGSVERAAPVDNTYVFETAGRPAQLEWGDEVFPIPQTLAD